MRKTMVLWFLIVPILILGGSARIRADDGDCDPFSFLQPNKPLPQIVAHKVPDYLVYRTNVVYSPGEDTAFRDLDILFHVDHNAVKRPAILVIHGGGWKLGDSTKGHEIMAIYATQGYVTLSCNYRLSGTAIAPAAVHDVKLAVRWMRANAAKYGIDPERIAVTGGSAGGHLTAMVAVTDPSDGLEGPHLSEYSSGVIAAMPLSGIYDLRSSEKSYVDPFLGGPAEAREKGLSENMSPTLFLTPEKAKTIPPMLVAHSEREMVPVDQVKDFMKALREIGREDELILLPGKVHGHQLIKHVRKEADAFFKKHLKPIPPVRCDQAEGENVERDHGGQQSDH
jgi:acetyl esterase/lipase